MRRAGLATRALYGLGIRHVGETTRRTLLAAAARPLSGKTFVLVGALPVLTREAAKEMIEATGDKVERVGLEGDRLHRRRRGCRHKARRSGSTRHAGS